MVESNICWGLTQDLSVSLRLNILPNLIKSCTMSCKTLRDKLPIYKETKDQSGGVTYPKIKKNDLVYE